ncbi:MAG: hypothetical protein WAX07_00365 [Candidatus Altiarchaeia archaeon]
MTLLGIMRESLELLYKEPKMFLPNMTVAAFYAIFELILLKISIDLFGNAGSLTQEELRNMMSSNIMLLLAILVFYPLIAALDLISYAMYPSMVSDHHNGKDISLRRAIISSLKAWRIWLSIGLVIAIFVVFITLIVSLFYVLYFLTQNYLYFILGVLVFFLAIVLLMLSIFFVMPIGIIDKERTFESFRKSYRLGRKNKKEVVSMVFLSFAVIGIAYAVGSNQAISSNRDLTALAVLAFMIIKMLQSTLYTYVSVINPNYYLHIKDNTHHKHAGHAGKHVKQ